MLCATELPSLLCVCAHRTSELTPLSSTGPSKKIASCLKGATCKPFDMNKQLKSQSKEKETKIFFIPYWFQCQLHLLCSHQNDTQFWGKALLFLQKQLLLARLIWICLYSLYFSQIAEVESVVSLKMVFSVSPPYYSAQLTKYQIFKIVEQAGTYLISGLWEGLTLSFGTFLLDVINNFVNAVKIQIWCKLRSYNFFISTIGNKLQKCLKN